MFGARLHRDLAALGAPFEVSSAGLLDWDQPADPGAVAAMAGLTIDITGHRSRPVSSLDLTDYELILTMTREHLREVVVDAPTVFPITFTAKAFARAVGAPSDEVRAGGLADQIRAISAERTTASMMGQSPDDDVADPYRLGQQEFDATAVELAELSALIARSLCSMAM